MVGGYCPKHDKMFDAGAACPGCVEDDVEVTFREVDAPVPIDAVRTTQYANSLLEAVEQHERVKRFYGVRDINATKAEVDWVRPLAAGSPNRPEPPPQPNEQPAVWDLVIADMHERDQTGAAKYGTRLQAFNGRDPLTDLYQELLDAVVYLRQYKEEKRRTAEQERADMLELLVRSFNELGSSRSARVLLHGLIVSIKNGEHEGLANG